LESKKTLYNAIDKENINQNVLKILSKGIEIEIHAAINFDQNSRKQKDEVIKQIKNAAKQEKMPIITARV
jgi:hypothetical protein